MSDKKSACGPLYVSMLEQFTAMDEDKALPFIAGFVVGQAEKVYLGACQAAMFHPHGSTLQWYDTVHAIVCRVAIQYKLAVYILPTNHGREIWIYKDFFVRDSLETLSHAVENSAGWHSIRAQLCGVPLADIDWKFHERWTDDRAIPSD